MRLSKKDLSYIKKYKEKLSVEAMAEKLGFRPATIKKHVEKFRKEEQKELAEEKFTEETTTKSSQGLDLMGRRSGAVTMTEAASMYADEALKRTKKMPSSRYKDCIKIFRKDDPIR